VIGLGKMGLLHGSILNVLPNVELTAFCEKDKLIRRFLKKVVKNVPVLDDVARLSDFDLDIVYVTTPIPSHFDVARQVYANKIARNLFIEKTLAASHAEAQEISRFAKQLSMVNMVGYIRRFFVTFKKAKILLDEEVLGEPSSFKAYAYSSDFLDRGTDDKISASRGGVMSDLGCYILDLANWFFGDLDVKSAEVHSTEDGSSSETIGFVLSQPGGLKGSCDVSWYMKDFRMPEVGFSISGSKGVLEVNDDKVELKLENSEPAKWYRHDLNDNVFFWLAAPEYFREDEYFVQSVLEGRKAEPSFESGSKVDRMIEDVMKKLG